MICQYQIHCYISPMSRRSDGKLLSKKCWALLRSNKYFMLFPILGVVLSLVPILIFGAFTIVVAIANITWLAWVIGFIGLIFVNFAFVIAGAALVASIDEELAGRNSHVGYGFGKAFGKLGPLFVWSIVRAVVTAILGLLRGRGNGAAAIVTTLIASAGAAAWSIITFFVTPHIMFDNDNAIDAIKKSAALVKAKWGTQLIGGVRIGLGVALILIPAIVLILGGTWLLSMVPSLGVAAILIGALLFLFGLLVGSALRAIFSVALYRFAQDESAIGDFTTAELAGVLTATK